MTQQFFGAVGYKGITGLGHQLRPVGHDGRKTHWRVSLKTSINPSLGPQSPTSFYDGKFVQKENNFNRRPELSLDGRRDWRARSRSRAASSGATRTISSCWVTRPPMRPGRMPTQPLYNCVARSCTPRSGCHGPPDNRHAVDRVQRLWRHRRPVDASQVSYAGYLDLEADVLKNLTLGLAGRHEHYASFGYTTLGKFQARWKVTRLAGLARHRRAPASMRPRPASRTSRP